MIRRAYRLGRHVAECVRAEMQRIEAERVMGDSARLWADFYAAQTESPVGKEAIRQLILEEAGHFLTDIEWRYAQARDLLNEIHSIGGGSAVAIRDRQLTAEDLNTQDHILTGYTVTANSPGAGNIAWASLRIVHAGVDYPITDGNTGVTGNRFVWFVKPGAGYVVGTAVALQQGNTKPTLTAGDLLVFINNAGTPIVAAGTSSASLPSVVANGAIDASALAVGAVSGTAIADGGVASGKLATGAISASTMFASSVVNATALGTNAVTDTKINAGAVTAGKLGAGAINGTTLFAAGVVPGTAVVAGAIDPTKLNTLTHELI